MKKAAVYIAVIVIIVAGVAIYFAAMGHRGSNSMGSMNMNTAASSNSKSVDADSVTIQNFAFSPANIAIKVGTKVTWTNKDSVAHTVTETDGQDGPQSSNVNPGSTYSFTYTKAGTYHYHCSIHPSMTGTVTVS